MDFKIALRSFRRNPGFACLAVLILALGIGANTAIFSVVYAVVLRPLAYWQPDRVVAVTTDWGRTLAGRFGNVSGPDFHDLHDHTTAFEAAASYAGDKISVVANGKPDFVGAFEVTPEFFKVFGVPAYAGRTLAPSDWKQASANGVVVSSSFWQRHFAGESFRAGTTVKALNQIFEIVGVMPPGFTFPDDRRGAHIWFPSSIGEQSTSRSAGNYRVVARLKPGVSLQQAEAQVKALGRRLAIAYPDSNHDKSFAVTRQQDYNVRRVRLTMFVLLGAVTLVLLIACANVANLLLARATSRVREIAIRTALGAGQARIVREVLTESVLLGTAGCLAGLLLASAGLSALVQLAPASVPRLDEIRIDAAVLAFSAVVAFASSLLFGLAPAVQASRIDPNEGLRQGGTRGIVGGATSKLRQSLVAVEIALSLILLVSAGLLLKSFSILTAVDVGFRPENLFVAEVNVPSLTAADSKRANEIYFKPLLTKLSNDPQVVSVALTDQLPGSGAGSNGAYIVSGQTMKDFTNNSPQAWFSVVSPQYFNTMSIPLVQGRAFAENDGPNSPPVVLINESLARRSFPQQDPLGKAIICGLDRNTMNWMTIVGVVHDVHVDGPANAPGPEIYFSYLQHPRAGVEIVAKTRTTALLLSNAFRLYSAQLNPEVPATLSTMENRLAATMAPPRFNSILVVSFALLALILASIGVYGIMSYAVNQRTAEIGLRIALGAERSDILGMVLSDAFKVTAAGVLLGLAGALAATRLLQNMLFEVKATDPAVYALVLLVLVSVSLLASYLPAHRAARTEAMTSLRQD